MCRHEDADIARNDIAIIKVIALRVTWGRRWLKDDGRRKCCDFTHNKREGRNLFVGNGEAKALGYDQADIVVLRNVDEDDRTKHTVIDRKGRTQSLMSSMGVAPVV